MAAVASRRRMRHTEAAWLMPPSASQLSSR